jgi:hypothetical protein
MEYCRRELGAREIELDNDIVRVREGEAPLDGDFTFIAKVQGRELEELYGRGESYNLCLKVFKERLGDTPVSCFKWKKATVHEAALVQNLFAWDDISPRIYDVVYLRSQDRVAYVTDFVDCEHEGEVGGNGSYTREQRVVLEKERAAWGAKMFWDHNPRNWRGDYFLDFDSTYIEDHSRFLSGLKSECFRHGAWGSKSYPYQTPEPLRSMDVESQRDIVSRVERMGLSDIDVKGKTVLDIGCSLGSFLQYATEKHATRVVGIDKAMTARLAYTMAMWEGYYNVDVLPITLRKERGDLNAATIKRESHLDEFDVIFALSIDHQIGVEDGQWLRSLGSKNCTLFVEGHVGQHKRTFEEKLESSWPNVMYLRKTYDGGPRPLFVCWNGRCPGCVRKLRKIG